MINESASQYGFGGRLKAQFPSQIIVDTTEVCNLACIHCLHHEYSKSAHYASRSLDMELNAKMVDEVRLHGNGSTQYIRYASSGEALTNLHAYDMIEYAVNHSGVFVALTTNGSIMNEKRTQRLLDSGLHMIDISIDAFRPETYARIRVNGKLDVTRANTLRLIEMARGSGMKTKVVVSFVEQPLNRDEMEDFELFWKDNGADYVVFRRIHSWSGSKTELVELKKKNEITNRRPCLYPWERIILNAAGLLSFCPADWYHNSPVADYRTTTIHEVWQGEYYKKLREAHLTNDFSNHLFCDQCPDWIRTRWPWEGRSYANMVNEFKSGEDDTTF